MSYERKMSEGVKLVPSLVIRIIRNISSKQQWERKELIAEVDRVHLSNGGITGNQSTETSVKRALQKLCSGSEVERVSFKTYRLHVGIEKSSEDEDVDEDLVIEKTIGSGDESVYVYFNPNDKELASLKNEKRWDCKIGRTSGSVSGRIRDQGIKTSFSRNPVVGLRIKTDYSVALERIIHGIMDYSEIEQTDGPGVEWYVTSPDEIERIYSEVSKISSTLNRAPTSPSLI